MQQQTAAQLLSEQRQMIDAIDQQLVTLFEQRMDVVRQVAVIKYDADLPVFDAKREQAVLARVTQQLQDETLQAPLTEWFDSLMQLSKKQQEAWLVAQQRKDAPHGALTEQP